MNDSPKYCVPPRRSHTHTPNTYLPKVPLIQVPQSGGYILPELPNGYHWSIAWECESEPPMSLVVRVVDEGCTTIVVRKAFTIGGERDNIDPSRAEDHINRVVAECFDAFTRYIGTVQAVDDYIMKIKGLR